MGDEKTGCTSCSEGTHKGFNYCFWAKLLVAIPGLPAMALIGASLFTNPIAQLVSAALFVGAAVFLAIQIDRMPLFMRPVRLK